MTTEAKSKKKNGGIKPAKFDEFIQNNWPKAKQEMEKGIHEAKKLIVRGEKHLGEMTDKGLKHLRITVLNHRQEKHYRELGRLAASLERTDLASNEGVTQQINDIKAIDQEIQSLQKALDVKKQI